MIKGLIGMMPGKVVAGTVGALALAGASMLGGGTPVEGAKSLGGLNINGFCISKYGGHARLEGRRDAGSWYCYGAATLSVNGKFDPKPSFGGSFTLTRYSIDTNEVCRWQYGAGAWSATSNWRDAYSWKCYR